MTAPPFRKCAGCGYVLGHGHAEKCSLSATPQGIQQTAQPMENDDLPGMLAVAQGVAEQKWPHTMDAAVWAREFCARFDITNAIVGEGDGDKESTMVGWFSNAIMAGYDTAQSRAASIQLLGGVPDGSPESLARWADCMAAVAWGNRSFPAQLKRIATALRAAPIQQTAQPVAWRIDYRRPCAGDVEYIDWRDLELGEKMEDRLASLASKGHRVTPLYAAPPIPRAPDRDFSPDLHENVNEINRRTARAIPREPTSEMNAAARRRVGFACPDLWHAMWDAAAKSAEP